MSVILIVGRAGGEGAFGIFRVLESQWFFIQVRNYCILMVGVSLVEAIFE
jgi:hypothetical protein